jgi:hypothetical protein
MTFFPIIELVDRYSIATLKFNKTKANQDELMFYKKELEKHNLTLIKDELAQLYDIHNQIWELEAELKSGHENSIPLEQIGLKAISIRNLNNQRIYLKNKMAEKLLCPVREIKQDHLSDDS